MHIIHPNNTTHITPFLSYGDQSSCLAMSKMKQTQAIVHACKEPCHRNAVGYSVRSLDMTHPHYLSFEKDNHLYMNMIDPDLPIFKLESFLIFMDFARRHLENGEKLHIHCNQGLSRAPSLAMLAMAKILDILPDNYAEAADEFKRSYPYRPGKGIEIFLNKNWHKIN